MRIKSLFQLLGVKGKPVRYGYTLHDLNLGTLGTLKYAKWKHPKFANWFGSLEEVQVSIPETVAKYQKFLNKGDLCLDIGAHSGFTSFAPALAVGPTGMVIALEPNSYLFPILEKNARQNKHLINIHPLFAAAAEHEGEMVFEYSDSGFCNGGRHKGISALQHGHAFKLSVFGIELSKELRADFQNELPKLKFIKIDAEGYDLFVVKSIADLITEFRPFMKIEVFKNTSAEYRQELVAFFLSLNYKVFKVENEPCEEGEAMSKDNVMKWQHYDIFCRPN